MRISDWSSDVCSSDLEQARQERSPHGHRSPMIAGALRQAVVQLPDASFRQVLVRSLLISITVFALLAAALWLGLMLIPDGGHSWIDWLVGFASGIGFFVRSEEHTSELQSLMRISYAVFCLNKKNK